MCTVDGLFETALLAINVLNDHHQSTVVNIVESTKNNIVYTINH